MKIFNLKKKFIALPLISILGGIIVALSILSYLKKTKLDFPNKAILQTNYGNITITFRERTPITTKNFLRLAKTGFYNGTRFHRVVENFMIQGGDPLSANKNYISYWGKGGPGFTFNDEIYPDDNMTLGVVAMVNTGLNTNGSQFFIVTTQDASWLNGKNTIFADVTEGLENAIEISKINTNLLGIPENDVIITNIVLKQ